MILIIVFMILGYLAGSLNSAMLVAKALKLADPREQGSKNPGATNILRMAGKQAATIVLVMDILKGLIPVWIACLFGVYGFGLGLVALACVLGHVFPAFYEFKGGKGVATSIGVSIGLALPLGILMGAIWVGVAFFLRISSLASLAAIGAAPILGLFFSMGYFIPLVAIALVVAYKHMDNIKRLQEGTEPKITWNIPPLSEEDIKDQMDKGPADNLNEDQNDSSPEQPPKQPPENKE